MNVAGFFQQASWRRDWPMLLVALFIAGGVAVPEVMSTGHGLLLVAALATMKWPRRELATGEKTFAWLLVAYWAYGLLSFFLGGQTELGESVLGRDLRLLLGVPVIFLVARLRWDAQMAGTALALAGFLCGFSALVEYAWNGMGSYRVSGPTVSIVFGNVCAALAAFNMAAAAVARGVPGRLHALASVSAIYAVFLTSTRGALVSLIVAFTVTLFLLPIAGRFRKRSFFTYTVLLSLLVAALTGHFGLRSGSLSGIVNDFEDAYVNRVNKSPVTGYQWTDEQLRRFRSDSSGILRIEESGSNRGPNAYLVAGDGRPGVWVQFPYRNAPAGTPLHFVARGSGYLRAPDGSVVKINSERWRRYQLKHSSTGRYDRMMLRVAEARTVSFLPRRDFTNEWEFSRYATSSGTRLMMWDFIVSRPGFGGLTGVGLGHFPLAATEGWESGEIAYFATTYDHMHNDLLNVLFERGTIGLLLLLALYGVPLAIFVRMLRHSETKPLALGGAAFVISMAVSGLTETMLIHSYSISFFAVMLAILVSTLHNTIDQLPEKS